MKNSPETLTKKRELREYYRRTIDPNSFPHEIIRKCKDCGQEKPCKWLSSFTQTGKPEYKPRCNDCHNKWVQSLAKKPHRKAVRNAKKKELIQRRKEYAVTKLGGKCKTCGYDKCLAALTFHHREPEHKEFLIGKMFEYSLENLDRELEKCDLLCFNCHMELHYLQDRTCTEQK